ncbi:MAG: tripartite tricarboxylate transporter permease, partial [Boseongicola sp.]|nr:tripartite tricarboxylate transporter permease [Boseongicola sp.]
HILSVPAWVLLPGVMMISFVGIYSLSGSYFDLLLMIFFGIIGWIFRKLDVPTVPIILGILLGNHMEDALRRAMILSDGDWRFLFGFRWHGPSDAYEFYSAIPSSLLILAVAGFLAPIFLRRVIKKPQAVSD